MKNKFWTGVLSGALCTLIASSLALGFYAKGVNQEIEQLKGQQTQEQALGQTQTSKEDDKDTKQFLQKVSTLEGLIDKYFLYDVNKDAYQEEMLKGLLNALDDPYSCYYTSEEYAEVMESTSGVYCGIGATVSQNINTGVITIVKPFVDGPAYKAGMLPGDILMKVNGEEVTGVELTSVVSDMKGEKGTDVMLTIMRADESKPIDIKVTRDEIEVPTVEYQMLEDNIGYIYILQFDKVTVNQFIQAVDKLEDQQMTGLIIDLRDNPGGLYDSAVDMLDRLIKDGLLVYTETKDGTKSKSYAETKKYFDKPLAVLVNGNSASASEIFAGAIQDYGIGTIVGTQSFGKGIVQSLIPLLDGSAVKITISDYYTPKGRSIHKVGITPDVIVELDEELKKKVVISLEEDNQLKKAIEVIKSSK